MHAQPVFRGVGRAGFGLAHNGNLTNTAALGEKANMLPGLVSSDSDLVAELLGQAFPPEDPSAPGPRWATTWSTPSWPCCPRWRGPSPSC